MERIKIKDLPKNIKVSRHDMSKISGGAISYNAIHFNAMSYNAIDYNAVSYNESTGGKITRSYETFTYKPKED